MKKIYFVLALLSCITFIQAQDEGSKYKNDEFKTIFGGKQIGGYGGIGFGYCRIDDKNALLFNARGAVIMNHFLAFGLAGSGFINDYTYNAALNKDVSLVGGYGGFVVEPIIFPKSGVHLSFPMIAGFGGVAYTTFNDQTDQWHQNSDIQVSQSFFIFEPGAELEFNLFHYMRMSFYSTYKFTYDLNWNVTPSNALDGFSAGIIWKFGKF
jgi:hypothetical protein